MEYQSFFMLLKEFSYDKNLFCSTNPFVAKGFVQIKKEQNYYSVVIQLNDFKNKDIAYVVCNENLAKINIISQTTKAEIDFALMPEKTCIFIINSKLFCCKNGTNYCQDAYKKVLSQKTTKTNKNILEKIFGDVYDTYFFDCIKPKLANLFTLGKPCKPLNDYFNQSKWICINQNGAERFFGVIYKNNFAIAVAVGSTQYWGTKGVKSYTINQKTYNICFLSASNGKIIDF